MLPSGSSSALRPDTETPLGGNLDHTYISLLANSSMNSRYSGGARALQSWPGHTYLWDGRLGLGSFAGIILRAEALCSSCLRVITLRVQAYKSLLHESLLYELSF